MLHHGLQVARLFLLFGSRLAKGVEDLVERGLEFVERGAEAAGDKGLREIGVADGVQKARQIAVGALDVVDEGVELVEQDEADDDGDGQMIGSFCYYVEQ